MKGAAAAMAALASGRCTPAPHDQIVPYLDMPEHLLPGKPVHFATASSFAGYGRGVLVESQMGRPIKIEGNPLHPASLGATDPWAQGEILSLWNPDRAKEVMHEGVPSTWSDWWTEIVDQPDSPRRIALLSGAVTSPVLHDQIEHFLAARENARWFQWDPMHAGEELRACELVFGRPAQAVYDLSQADVVVSIASDLLYMEPGSLRYARDFADRRGRGVLEPSRWRTKRGERPRLYAAETMPTVTSAMADHHLPLRPSEIERLVITLANELGAGYPEESAWSPSTREDEEWLASLIADLRARPGRSLIAPGGSLSAEAQAICHWMNQQLGNVGSTVRYDDPILARPESMLASIRELVEAIDRGEIDILLIAGTNPVYTAPPDLHFEEAMRRVPHVATLSETADETTAASNWSLPMTHFLEEWGDIRAWDGTVTIRQPLIEPLHGGRSLIEVLSMFDGAMQPGYDIVRDYWLRSMSEKEWRQSVRIGIAADSPPAITTSPATAESAPEPGNGGSSERSDPARMRSAPPPLPIIAVDDSAAVDLEVAFRPDPTVLDGRYSNNGWLQELPKPLTGLTWDNAIMMSPRTASSLDLESEEMIEIEVNGRLLRAAAWVVPGHADGAITLHFGYGRRRTESLQEGFGFDAFALSTSVSFWRGSARFERGLGERYPLATTQNHHRLEGRDMVRHASYEEFRANPFFAKRPEKEPAEDETLYDEFDYESPSWGMAIDLNVCIGCGGCTIACQAENNIPYVGKEQVLIGREMHWIRVDRYVEGDVSRPRVFHQPVPCMHCENAPCEVVCPVEATLHSNDGLNEMIYNRCIGTRYCSNNCPYKVRRFNFHRYTDGDAESLALMRNPEVTVRERGVMEKCTYCVQRIERARIDASKEMRPIRDGEIVTACQQVCPTRAITFGDVKDPDTEVSVWKRSPRNYAMLEELNTRPRTTYLARLGWEESDEG